MTDRKSLFVVLFREDVPVFDPFVRRTGHFDEPRDLFHAAVQIGKRLQRAGPTWVLLVLHVWRFALHSGFLSSGRPLVCAVGWTSLFNPSQSYSGISSSNVSLLKSATFASPSSPYWYNWSNISIAYRILVLSKKPAEPDSFNSFSASIGGSHS